MNKTKVVPVAQKLWSGPGRNHTGSVPAFGGAPSWGQGSPGHHLFVAHNSDLSLHYKWLEKMVKNNIFATSENDMKFKCQCPHYSVMGHSSTCLHMDRPRLPSGCSSRAG